VFTIDKLTIGIVAGLTGDIVKNLLTLIGDSVFKLHPSYWDYGHYFLFLHLSDKSPGHFVLSMAIEFIFGILVTVVYVYIKDAVKTNHIYIRGAAFGWCIWFSIRCVIAASRVTELNPAGPWPIIWNWTVAVVFGLVVSWVIKWAEKKARINRVRELVRC